MSEEIEEPRQQITAGGLVARHRATGSGAALLAPTASVEFNTLRRSLSPIACLRLNDIRFAFDSSFVSPLAAEEFRLLAQLRREIPGLRGSLFGHADPVDNDAYNKKLSGRRAASVYALLTRRVEIWEDIFTQQGVFTSPLAGDSWETTALQVMLKRLGHYDGHLTGQLDKSTRAAVASFQLSSAGAGLEPDGEPGPLTRPRLYLAYMDAVCVDEQGASFQMSPAEFLAGGADPYGRGDYQGCGEFNPVLLFSQAEHATFQAASDKTERNLLNQPNRRVLMFLFHPQAPFSPARWPCPRAKEGSEACRARFYAKAEERRSFRSLRREYWETRDTFACRFYDRLAFESPCEIGPPLHVNTLRVHLRMVFRDPDPAAPSHDFPENFPVVVVYGDGTEEQLRVGAGGRLSFEVRRSRGRFTLNFEFAETQYLASKAGADGTAQERIITEANVREALDEGYRIFSLPPNPPERRWEMADFDWLVEGGASFHSHAFEGLEEASTTIGSETTPVMLRLDPHWQYLRFEYFDRYFGHSHHRDNRISLPPLVLEGLRQRPVAGAQAVCDTRSNWTINDDDPGRMCHCLPWVVRRRADRVVEAKPDAGILLRFRTVPGTFIETLDADTRRLVTLAGRAVPADPGVNSGAATGFDPFVPCGERLKFYDLPPVWKSTRYFTRLTEGAGRFFEELTDEIEESTDPNKYLTFCLDDMVLCHAAGDGALAPLNLKSHDRVAIFSHRFANTDDQGQPDPLAEVTATGLFRADDHLPWFSYLEPPFPAVNYLAQYPDWTRLVVAGGNLFDVFDARTPEAPDQVVGARAAVRWVDATAAGVGRPAGHTFQSIEKRPGRTKRPFFALQPYYEQEYIPKLFPLAPGTYDFLAAPDITADKFRVRPERFGHFDLAALRCCDVDENGDEIAVCFEYYGLVFDFANPQPRDLYIHDAVVRTTARWNGEANYNSGPAWIEAKPSSSVKLRAKVVWFAQALDEKAQARCVVSVATKIDREHYAPTTGTIYLDEFSHVNTVAHECGHAGSLPDEYVEIAENCCSYGQASVFSNEIPGDPYSLDTPGMMISNLAVRGRYFWHVAEWFRSLYGGSYRVRHDDLNFEVPEHAYNRPGGARPARNFVNWPLKAAIEARLGLFRKFDLYFYALGADGFSTQLIKPDTSFDGIIVIMLKMKVSLPAEPAPGVPLGIYGRLTQDLQRINEHLDRRFNKRWRAAGEIGRGVPKFNNCLLHFSFRYLVPTVYQVSPLADEQEQKSMSEYLSTNGGGVEGYKVLARDMEELYSGIHLDIRVSDPSTSKRPGKRSRLIRDHLRLRSDDLHQVDKFIAKYLGVSTDPPAGGGPWPAPDQLRPLLKPVMTKLDEVSEL